MSTKNKLFAGANASMKHLDKQTLGNKTYVEHVPLDLIDPNPYQPRKLFDEESLELLGQNIKAQGLDQPITLVKQDKRYILVMGERRVRASRLAKLETIKAVIVDYDNDTMQKKALWENILREDLSPVEIYDTLIQIKEREGIKTIKDTAAAVNMSYSQVRSFLSFSNLNAELFELYRITEPTVAIQVMERLSTVESKQKALAYFNEIVKMGLSRKKALEFINNKEDALEKPKAIKKPPRNIHTWGKSTKTKAKFELRIIRKNIPKELDSIVEEKLQEIYDLLQQKE